MIYMSIEETYSYTLPKLMADLGGCLGLYLGVSVISIIEFIDLFGSATILCLLGTGESRSSERRTGSRKRRRRNQTAESGPPVGECGRQAKSAARLYRERFAEGPHPTRQTILKIVKRLRETGCVTSRPRVRRPHNVGHKVQPEDVARPSSEQNKNDH
ncbi:hypothetical protein AVEN_269554-1 [Araneus ventricosus]|uniref:DUF4817 domain-containing protein n=1 Tax=Araneus ventricosus TaxID=182803 RepID=A0A4Y2CC63_ARAVE|nr:hypothetical protein AVEN_269554-1 [Araneus ventricosus]